MPAKAVHVAFGMDKNLGQVGRQVDIALAAGYRGDGLGLFRPAGCHSDQPPVRQRRNGPSPGRCDER